MCYRKYFCFAVLLLGPRLLGQTATLQDAYPEKARYAPHEPVRLNVELGGEAFAGTVVSATVTDLDKTQGSCGPVTLSAKPQSPVFLSCSVPDTDFRGYLITVELRSTMGKMLSTRTTALDISSDWKRFPRYGYLAQYNEAEGARPAEWIAELSRFHINGLQFYDFQYRHDQPLAGSVDHPSATWKDIAGRKIEAEIVQEFIQQAHARNMMAMAYNASYSAYEDVFTRPTPLPLEWATWTSRDGPRNAKTAKNLPMHIPGGETSKLFYMNQNASGWQNYLFGQMQRLFKVYPFDGWHVDTFGEKGGFAYDRSPVNYVSGFPLYIDRAHQVLDKRILFNAVNTWGQEKIAESDADFVYSELWEDHETFSSILATAEQVRLANPQKAYVVAAYVNESENKDDHSPSNEFNTPSVLLTDATIFASGAAHIELGDGDRMLSSEYFPKDTNLTVSPQLHDALRHYYDFLTAYEAYFRCDLKPADVSVTIEGEPVDALGVPNAIWFIGWQKGQVTVVHLINLLGSEDPHWRDVSSSRPDAPKLNDLRLKIVVPKRVISVGWATPDRDGGQFHTLPFKGRRHGTEQEIEVRVPTLQYWDALVLKTAE